MTSFINQVITQLHQSYGDNYHKVCVVFPTRRACLIFRNHLAKFHGKPVFAPGVLGIGDFVSRHVKTGITEEIPLLLTLYEVYKKHWPEQDFSRFYGWGQMLLSDFDEIDKQLSEPSRLFSNIGELRKIEAAFLPDSGSLDWIQEFIKTFDSDQLTFLQNEFMKSWNQLKDVYLGFNELLLSKKQSYEGKAYRELIQQLRKGSFSSQWNEFVFAGFYGFSRAEEDLIKLLGQKFKVSTFWDGDEYYINNPMHEAGYYFRKTDLVNETTSWIGNHFADQQKKITVTGVPLQVAQAKYAGDLLHQLIASQQIDINQTVIILADENMLFPVLYAIPESVPLVNVTMGYPLQQSQFATFLELLQSLHKSMRIINNEPSFLYDTVDHLLHHPLLATEKTQGQIQQEGYMQYLSAGQIKQRFQRDDNHGIFRQVTSTPDLFGYLKNIFNQLHRQLHPENQNAIYFEDAVITFISNELESLHEALKTHENEIPVTSAWQMIRESIAGLKVPFTGEPVRGLQVMGFLETRALDFKHIIFLGCNEGILPANSSGKSFIPYALRKGFGLATHEDQDASYSYHFYRLFHKAETAHLIYNTEVGKTGGGEPSRYLLQIAHELKKFMGDKLSLERKIISTPVITAPAPVIAIRKTQEVLQSLEKYTSSDDNARSFSSSALTTYMNCSLQFYFRYIAGLKEKDLPSNEIAADTFGNILHDALEQLYINTGEQITEKDIQRLLESSGQVVNAAIEKIYFTKSTELTGNDILLAEVIHELIVRILKQDQQRVPFKIAELEKLNRCSLNFGEKKVNFYGKFDRVDEKDGIIQILDYKTGAVSKKSKSIENLFSDPQQKSYFQLYFYMLLYSRQNPGKPVMAGLYVAKSLRNGIQWACNGNPVTDEELSAFEAMLKGLVTEILNPAVNFTQTDKVIRCAVCEFKTICQR